MEEKAYDTRRARKYCEVIKLKPIDMLEWLETNKGDVIVKKI